MLLLGIGVVKGACSFSDMGWNTFLFMLLFQLYEKPITLEYLFLFLSFF